MSLIKCKECDAEISKDAKECPSCGAPNKAKPKEYGCGTLILLLFIVFIFYVIFSGDDKSTSSTPSTTSNSAVHNSVLAHFKSDKEKTAKDAIWGSSTTLKIGVIHDGTNRDGYARYVCSVLTDDFKMSGSSLRATIFDIAKIANQGKWEMIGSHYCSDK